MFDQLKKTFGELLNSISKKKDNENNINITNSVKDIDYHSKDSIVNEEKKKQEIKVEEKELDKEIKLGIGTKIATIFSPTIKLNEKELSEILETFELMLLEADVNIDVAEKLKNDLYSYLKDKEFNRNAIQFEIKKTIKEYLIKLLSEQQYDLIIEITKKQKVHGYSENRTKSPYVILFFGLNGNGKTTTIAKIAKYLSKFNLSSVVSASDTFRAGAIEQLDAHAKKLGIPIISRGYKADPISVAFDAVNYAKAHNIDVVLIDTAGRQETNRNLIEELSKFNRVINPDLRVYVVESTIGNAAVEQIQKFHEKINIDAIILTKVDLDAKGGLIISAKKLINKPILFLCTGQDYDAIEPFDAEKFVEKIL
ncbi:MAG: signal recognition particle-docking protein FtsY [Candidatus Anstonellales archaeon]